MYRLMSFFTLLIAAAGCIRAEQAEPPQGAKLLAPFKQELQLALRTGLAGGPGDAIAACRLKAPAIATELSREGVRLGRTSDRLRNPANVGPQWVVPVLQGYANNPADRTAKSVHLTEQRTGYVEPIIIQPLCLTCHGDKLAPDIRSRIGQLYPEDRAVGYRVGDLRGVFWIEYTH